MRFIIFPALLSSGVTLGWCTWHLSSALGIFLCWRSSTGLLVNQAGRRKMPFDLILHFKRRTSSLCACRFITGCGRRGSLHLSVGSWFQKGISWLREAQDKSAWCKPCFFFLQWYHWKIDFYNLFVSFLTFETLLRFLFWRSRLQRVRLSARTSLRAFIWSTLWSPAPRSTDQTSTWMSIASLVTLSKTSNSFSSKNKGRPCWFL